MDKIDELFAEWMALQAFGDSTRSTYGSMFSVVSAWLYEHDIDVRSVSEASLTQFFASRGVSAGTERRYLMLLRDYFDFLISRHVASDNPAQLLLSKRKRKKKSEQPAQTAPVLLTEDEVQILLETLKGRCVHFADIRRRTLIIVMLCCGLSTQEVCELRWKSVALTKKKELHLPHGRRVRRVPLTATLTAIAAAALLEWKNLCEAQRLGDGSAEQFVFVKGKNHRPYKPSGIYRLVRSGMLLAGIDNSRISPKALRNTFAARNLSLGVPLETVQAWLGHGSTATTSIYKRRDDAAHSQPARDPA